MNEKHPLLGKRLAAYCRVSSDKQDGARQKMNIQAWADRNGLVIAQWFDDTHGNNPRDLSSKRLDFQRMLRTAESGAIDAIIVDSLDRFGVKNAWEFGHYVHQLTMDGVELWSVLQGNLSAADPATILTSTVGAITSKEEQREKAHRSLQGKMLASLRGLYTGGYPPFGLDCVCFGVDGKEKWRLIWIGHHKRVKVATDGTEEIFEGKDNGPSKDRQDELRLRPSVRAERIEIVRNIFHWFVEESISPSQIATRLNELNIDPVFGQAWNKQKVKQLLKHPIYIGLPTSNKRGNGRHKEFVNGQEQTVREVNGRAKGGRNRLKTDWWQPASTEFEPIVEPSVFDAAQRKSALSSDRNRNPSRKAPRTASFWLRGFVICAQCGLPMRAWNAPGYRSYFCANYGTYGRVNPTGCRSNRVKADLIEQIVEKYLSETDERAVMFLAANRNERTPGGFDERAAARRFQSEWARMNEFILDSLPEGETAIEVFASTLDGKRVIPSPPVVVTKHGDDLVIDDEGFSIFDLFRHLHEQRRKKLAKEIAEKEHSFKEAFERFKRLTSDRAIDHANAEMERIEEEIKFLTSQMQPLDHSTREAWREVQRLSVAAKHARTVLGEANYRRRAEALKGVVDRIVCQFRLNDVSASNQPKSLLEVVEIYPVTGEKVTRYPKGTRPGPG